MRKGFFGLAVLVLAVFFSSFAAPRWSQGEAKTAGDEPRDADGFGAVLLDAQPEELFTPVRDYGESAGHIVMDEDFSVRILYPHGGLAPLDRALEDWAHEAVESYRAELEEGGAGEGGAELTVDYNSYVLSRGVVSVEMSGIFVDSALAHPLDVYAAFNARGDSGELLSLSELLLPGGEEKLRERVIRIAGIEEDVADDGLLAHWLLSPDGLKITLVRGDYLPMSEGTQTLLFGYGELKDILTLPESSVPSVPPEPEREGLEIGVVERLVDPTKPMVALTFDDGPSAHTERLLDIFAAKGGKGTFFVVGNMLEGRGDTLRRMASEGHEIGGHTWSHRQLTNISVEEMRSQISSTHKAIRDLTGEETSIMRPPYGACNAQVKAIAGELGVALINWSVDTLDWKTRDADAVYEAVMNSAADGAIILCHDLHKSTVDAMERVIPALQEKGFQLVTVSQLLGGEDRSLEAGVLYFNR